MSTNEDARDSGRCNRGHQAIATPYRVWICRLSDSMDPCEAFIERFLARRLAPVLCACGEMTRFALILVGLMVCANGALIKHEDWVSAGTVKNVWTLGKNQH